MINEARELVFLMLVAGRKQKDALLTALPEVGGRIINVVYGRGTVQASYLMDMLGLVPEEHKVVIICLLSKDRESAIFNMLIEKFHFNEPNTGIAFSIPIDKLSF